MLGYCMACGEAIQADATACAKCGNAFARPPEPSPPSSDGDPRTVAMHQVPDEVAEREAPFVSKHGTAPLDPDDIPREPPSSAGPGTLMMETEGTDASPAEPAAPEVEPEEKPPDSGRTQVMPQPHDADADPRPIEPPQQRGRRADPFARTAKANEMTPEVRALREAFATRGAAGAAAAGPQASPPAEAPRGVAPTVPDGGPEPERRPKPQHFEAPPGAAQPLPITGEFTADEPPPSLPQPTIQREAVHGAGAGDAMSMVAGTARIISEAFNSGFGASLPGWRTEVTAPMGMSTEGGKQALMPITLVNDDAQRIAIGHADAAHRGVQLKSHGAIARTYVKRYNRIWDVSPEQYAALLDGIRGFFAAMQFDFVVDDGVEDHATLAPLSRLSQNRNLWLAVAIIFTALSILLLIYAAVR